MRSGRGIAVAAFGCAILTHHDARAQDAYLQGVFTGSIGVTDNVSSAAEPPAGPGPDADGFGTASPGLIFTYATPRTAQTLSYTFSTSFFFRHWEASSYSNLATWSGRFVTSPRTSLTLGATGSQGQLNTFQLEQTPGTTTLQGTAGGTTNFVQGSFNEGFSFQASPVWSLGQAATFLIYNPLQDYPPPPRTYSAANTLTAQRAFRHDVAALALSVGYTHFDNVDIDPTTAVTYASRDQLISTLVASWQHDLGRRFSSQLDVGGVVATDLAGDAGSLARPAGLAALRYTHDRGEAELAYAYSATPNVFLQQIQLSHQLTLRAAAPIHPSWHLSVEGSAGAQLAQPLEPNTEGDLDTGPTTIAVLTDVALLWSPVLVIPDFALALRYQHTNQRTEGRTVELEGRKEKLPDTRIVRNALLLSVSGAFPRRMVPGSRISMTQPFGSAGPSDATRRQETPSEPLEGEAPTSAAAGDAAR
ncbi:hypothetical protein [Sorangium sp. So ce1000]|uniref:hypothetical protein n=1 Tax=Sorangium sp. So ce1000 TaxID=3133325 RepID=UPI003F616B13